MLKFNCYISFCGNVTFKKSDKILETLIKLPLDKILLETDSPYLAPTPHRGKRCEPALVLHTLERLANLHGLPVEQLGAITVENARRLFDLR